MQWLQAIERLAVVHATKQLCQLQQTTKMQQSRVYCLQADVYCSHSLPLIVQNNKKSTQHSPAGQPDRPALGVQPCRHRTIFDEGCEADRQAGQGLQPSPDGVPPCSRLRLRDIEAPASANKRGAPCCQHVPRRGPRPKIWPGKLAAWL